MKAVIETKRLLLRNFRLSDAESMFESYCHNENITRYLTWYPHVDVQATRDFITQFQLPGIEKDNALDLAITLKGKIRLLGVLVQLTISIRMVMEKLDMLLVRNIGIKDI